MTRQLTQFIFFVAISGLTLAGSQTNAQSIEESAKWIPATANYVAIVRAKRILESELAKEKDWRSDRKNAFQSGMSKFPETTESVFVASKIDFEAAQPLWTASVIRDDADSIDMVEVSKNIGGSLDKIGSLEALSLPNDAMIVRVDPKTLFSLAPANRQMIYRQLQMKSAGTTTLSPYLKSAIKYADQNADIIIAFDLAGVASPTRIAQRLREKSVFESDAIDEYAKKLASMTGVTLGVTVKEEISGSIKVEFADPIDIEEVKAKEIFLGALKDNGLLIDDMETWQVKFQAGQVLVKGKLSILSLQRIASLIEQPFLAAEFESNLGDASVDTLTRSKQYFSDIAQILDLVKQNKSKSLEYYSKWFDRSSAEIDQLDILGVDEELVDYGIEVANRFREIAGSLDKSNYDRFNDASRYRNSYRSYGRYNDGYNNSTSRKIARESGTMKGANKAKELFREIATSTSAIRKAMTEKYKTEF